MTAETRRLALLALLFALAACSSAAQRFAEQAAALGLDAHELAGTKFMHVVYRKEGKPGGTLHVYLGGDGTPWFFGQPTTDPTPRNPLMLRLIALDPSPAIYLGRPCYHGHATDAPCASSVWTSGRYSERVVASMEAAVRRLMAQGRYERIAWFGHSGGGALAVFLAARFRATAAVVTIAGNLDTDAWADHHGYERLAGSLNPARQPALPRHILQLHYAGGRDKVVPPHVTQRGVNGDRAKLILVEDFDHVCCWEEAWPEILTEVTRYLADAARPD